MTTNDIGSRLVYRVALPVTEAHAYKRRGRSRSAVSRMTSAPGSSPRLRGEAGRHAMTEGNRYYR